MSLIEQVECSEELYDNIFRSQVSGTCHLA